MGIEGARREEGEKSVDCECFCRPFFFRFADHVDVVVRAYLPIARSMEIS